MEAQLKKALTIAVKVQASKKKRKADNLDDNVSQMTNPSVAVVTRMLLDYVNKLSNVMIVTSGITMFVLVLGPVMLIVCPGKCHGQ